LRGQQIRRSYSNINGAARKEAAMKSLLAHARTLSVLSVAAFSSVPLLAGDAEPPNMARNGALVAVQISTTNPQALLDTWVYHVRRVQT
jgi:hypothetical protein